MPDKDEVDYAIKEINRNPENIPEPAAPGACCKTCSCATYCTDKVLLPVACMYKNRIGATDFKKAVTNS